MLPLLLLYCIIFGFLVFFVLLLDFEYRTMCHCDWWVEQETIKVCSADTATRQRVSSWHRFVLSRDYNILAHCLSIVKHHTSLSLHHSASFSVIKQHDVFSENKHHSAIRLVRLTTSSFFFCLALPCPAWRHGFTWLTSTTKIIRKQKITILAIFGWPAKKKIIQYSMADFNDH